MILRPPDESISIGTEDTTGQRCGESNVAEKWINGHSAAGQKFREQIGRIQKTLHSWWRRNFCVSSEEADHLANLGTEGKITIEHTEDWKAVRVFWDGSAKMAGVGVALSSKQLTESRSQSAKLQCR